MRRHDFQLTSVELSPQTIASYDCLIIATNHSAYDWHTIVPAARLIIDTRGATRRITGPRDHIVTA
jgi:UDP-N-acetyl-D-glucosamine dehydrogenase